MKRQASSGSTSRSVSWNGSIEPSTVRHKRSRNLSGPAFCSAAASLSRCVLIVSVHKHAWRRLARRLSHNIGKRQENAAHRLVRSAPPLLGSELAFGRRVEQE